MMKMMRTPSRRRIIPLLRPSSTTTTTTTPPPPQPIDYDIVIVGGGIVGATLVDQLIQQQQVSSSSLPFLRIALIESTIGPTRVPLVPAVPRIPHPRSYALSPTSIQLIFGTSPTSPTSSSSSSDHHNHHDIHPNYMSQEQGYYTRMQVWEAQQPASLIWTTHDLLPQSLPQQEQEQRVVDDDDDDDDDDENTSNNTNTNTHNSNTNNHQPFLFLGWCIEDYKLQQYLWYHKLHYTTSVPHTSHPTTAAAAATTATTTTTNPIHDDALSSTTSPREHHHSWTNPDTNLTIYTSTTLQHLEWPTAHTNSSSSTTSTSSTSSSSSWVTGTLVSTSHNDTNHNNDNTSASSNTNNNNNNSTTTTPFRTRLLIAADGGQSKVRQLSGITMEQYSYQQTALTFTVQYPSNTNVSPPPSASSHHRCAYQRYLPNGSVLALLPTYDISNYGIVVYSTSTEEAQYWKDHAFPNNKDNHNDPNNTNDRNNTNNNNNNTTGRQDLVNYLNHMLQTGPERLPSLPLPNNDDTSILGRMVTNALYGIEQVANTVQYGMSMAAQSPPSMLMMMDENDHSRPALFHAPPLIEQIVSAPFTFPLTCQIPRQQQYTISNYLALVGDAAHTVHPMAGQGLNLGLQDVMALRDTIMKARNSGMDVGTYLHEYNTSRQLQVSTTVAGIHGLQQLLCHPHGNGIIGKHMKAFGMNCIQNIQPLRQTIVRAACYGV